MGGFDEHLRWAIAAAIVVTAVAMTKLVQWGVLETIRQQFLFIGLLFGIIVLVGILPDIDVHSSIPRRHLGKAFLAGAATLPLYLLVRDPSRLRSLGGWVAVAVGLDNVPLEMVGGLILLVVGVFVAKSIGIGLDELTTHRGFLHSKEFIALCGVFTFLALSYLNILPTIAVAIVAAGAVVGGIVHVYVVDVFY